MTILCGNNDLQSEFIKRLGLPETTYELNIDMDAGGVAKCTCRFYMTEEDLEYVMGKNRDAEKERPLRRLDSD